VEVLEDDRDKDILEDFLGNYHEGYPEYGGNHRVHSAVVIVVDTRLLVVREDDEHSQCRVNEGVEVESGSLAMLEVNRVEFSIYSGLIGEELNPNERVAEYHNNEQACETVYVIHSHPESVEEDLEPSPVPRKLEDSDDSEEAHASDSATANEGLWLSQEELREDHIKDTQEANKNVVVVEIGLIEIILDAIGIELDDDFNEVNQSENYVHLFLADQHIVLNGVLIVS
jgi:hypothetical protein